MALIETDQLEKKYEVGDSTVHALDKVSLQISAGEFVAVMGPSGSGKSTFMNVIGCLDVPTAGRYLLDGIDVGRMGHDALAEIRNLKIGFVFQGFNLLSRTTALENVEVPLLYSASTPKDHKNKAREALKLLGLEDRRHHHPNQLSGGQQQRVAIARALMNRPPVILADEPTGNLDTENSAAVYRLFREINADLGTTFLIVTHDRGIAEQTDRIIEVVDGELVQDVRNTYLERG